MPTTTLTDDDFTDGKIGVLDMMQKAGLIKSRGEGRRLIEQNGVKLNDEKVDDVFATLTASDFENEVIIKKGKKTFHKFVK